MAYNPNTGGVGPGKNDRPKALTPAQRRRRKNRQDAAADRRKDQAQAARRRKNDPLRRTPDKKLARQARRATRAQYKPTLVALRNEQQRLDKAQAKRQADNKVFQQWLADQASKTETAMAAADQAAQQQVQANMDATAQRYKELGVDLIGAANSRSSTGEVLPNAQDSGIAGPGGYALANQELTANQLTTMARDFGSQRSQLNENTRNQLVAIAAEEWGDYWKSSRDIADARMETRAKRAADATDLFYKLKGMEMDKAKLRLDRRQDKRDFRLKQAALKLDEKKLQAQIDMNNADNATSRANNAADNATSRANDKNDGGSSDENKGDPVDRRARLKTTREMNSQINSVLEYIRNTPKLLKAYRNNNLQYVKNEITDKGLPYYLVQPVLDLAYSGSLSPRSRSQIRGAGGLPKRIVGSTLPKQPVNTGH